MKLFADRSHYTAANRYTLNDVVKALWNERTPEERVRVYGQWVTRFEAVPEPAAAEVCLLPMKWHYYRQHHLLNLAQHSAAQAQQAGKPFVIFSGGDSPARVNIPGAYVFEQAGYRSRQDGTLRRGLPASLPDYLQLYGSGQVVLRKKAPKPVVGFCGQGGGNPFQAALRRVLNVGRRGAFGLGLLAEEPPPFETTAFRERVLRVFERSAGVQTNFIRRNRYRAGVQAVHDHHHPSRLEFVRNILDSDYTLCMRGGGNFSVRFYETLSLGRIPVFIDTDCLLPWHNQVDYRKYFVWIEQGEIPHAAEKLADFHAGLSADDFEQLQLNCRRLWVEYLSMNGFYCQFSRGSWIR